MRKSSFLNMQVNKDDSVWLTFRYTTGLYREGFKSSILVDFATLAIEAQLFGEICATLTDGETTYLAVHPPLENNSDAYSRIALMVRKEIMVNKFVLYNFNLKVVQKYKLYWKLPHGKQR